MELSAPQFLQVLAEVVGRHDVSERRQSPRIVLNRKLTIAPIYSGRRSSPIVAKLHDLARGGVGLLLQTPLAPGSHFMAYLPRASGETLEVRCQVCQCRPAKDAGFIAGAQFDRLSMGIPVKAHWEGRPESERQPEPAPERYPALAA